MDFRSFVHVIYMDYVNSAMLRLDRKGTVETVPMLLIMKVYMGRVGETLCILHLGT